MKKIIAGVLAAASMLSVSATAFADTKSVTKAGDVTYDVAVGAPKIVLNLVMPAKLAAALNPYGAKIVMTAADSTVSPAVTEISTTNKIGSATYKIVNNSRDYGVFIDATAITTVATTDKEKWNVEAKAVTAGKKGAQLALIAATSNAAATLAPTTPTTNKEWAKGGSDGALVMDSTVAADRTAGVAAGQTSVKKLAFVKAAVANADTSKPDDAGIVYLGFTGTLADDDATNKKYVEWKEDDAINVSLVLKVSPGPTTYTS